MLACATAMPRIEHWENPGIPSGYTYLLQFVAHDLVHSAIPLSVAGELGADTANARRTPLKLETLFGSGPVGSPFVYAQDTPNDERRTKLRLGRMRWKDKDVESGCPFRDIARTPAENVTGIDRSIPGRRVALTEALVADPRNDDHAMMSQTDGAVCAAAQRPRRHGSPRRARRRDQRQSRRRLQAVSLRARRADRDLSQHHPQRPDEAGDASGDLRGLFRAARTSSTGRRISMPVLRPPACGREMAGRFRSNSPTARSASATRWSGPNTSSTICPPTISAQHAGKDLGERSGQHAAGFDMDGAMVALLRDRRDRGPISAAASVRFSATGWAMTRYFPPSIRPTASACSIAISWDRRSPDYGRWMR